MIDMSDGTKGLSYMDDMLPPIVHSTTKEDSMWDEYAYQVSIGNIAAWYNPVYYRCGGQGYVYQCLVEYYHQIRQKIAHRHSQRCCRGFYNVLPHHKTVKGTTPIRRNKQSRRK